MAISLALFLASTLFRSSQKYHAARNKDSYGPLIQISFCLFALASVAGLVFGSGLIARMPLIGAWYLVPLSAVFIADLGAVLLRERRDLPGIIPFGFGVITLGMLTGGALLVQMPYLIYGRVTVYEVFTGADTARILFGVFGVGAAITLPALIVLFAAHRHRQRRRAE
jgi:cytochrome bd-type quinol oxidase subunit 2